MPRGRGGRREGTIGSAYSNRTDLRQNVKTLPVKTVPGQPYGQAAAQEASQRAMPVGVPQPAIADPSQGQQAFPNPDAMPPIDAPTDRPGEPLTAGLSTGPGPGPEALNLPQQDGPDPDLASMARYLPVLELMAGDPNASVASRNFVRRLRGSIPPGI